MDIDRLKFDNKQELRQVAEYGYVVVGDSAKRASEIEWLLAERDRLASENAELRATDQYQRALDEMHLRYNVEEELARVKAESLRVVADGEANKAGVLKNNTTFVVSNVLHVNHWHGAYIRMGGGSWRGEVGYDTIVQPVRIERWED